MSGFGRRRTLRADGLVLTSLRLSDAAELLAGDRDPETARRFGWELSDPSLEKCRAHVRRAAEWWRTGERAVFAVREHTDGPLLGIVEARGWRNRYVELSWMTLPSRRGSTIATRAVRAARDWCFRRGTGAIWASIEEDNSASLAVARAAGFREQARDQTRVLLRVDAKRD